MLTTLNSTPHARFNDPMKAIVDVDVDESELLSREACKMPQQLICVVVQNVRHDAEKTTVQPYPPSGIAVVLKSVSLSVGEGPSCCKIVSFEVDEIRCCRPCCRAFESSMVRSWIRLNSMLSS